MRRCAGRAGPQTWGGGVMPSLVVIPGRAEGAAPESRATIEGLAVPLWIPGSRASRVPRNDGEIHDRLPQLRSSGAEADIPRSGGGVSEAARAGHLLPRLLLRPAAGALRFDAAVLDGGGGRRPEDHRLVRDGRHALHHQVPLGAHRRCLRRAAARALARPAARLADADATGADRRDRAARRQRSGRRARDGRVGRR